MAISSYFENVMLKILKFYLFDHHISIFPSRTPKQI